MTIHFDGWLWAAIGIGFLVPMFMTACLMSMGIFWIAERSFRRSRAGRLMRHTAARAWPNKFTRERSK